MLLDFTPNFNIGVGYTMCGHVMKPTYLQREATRKSKRQMTRVETPKAVNDH